MIRSDSIARAFFTVLFTYLFSLGATFNGVLLPITQQFTLWMMALTAGGWLLFRSLRRWPWYRTPLDAPLVLWALAFALSLAANSGGWRHIFIGLWYAGVYMGVWYLLQDLISRRIVSRDSLIDAFLISGIIIIIFGYVQLYNLLSSGTGRPGSLLGNPNALGAFLIVVICFTFTQALLSSNGVSRFMMGMYTTLASVLWFMTFSRGAWLGLTAALAMIAALSLSQRGLFSPGSLKVWWAGRQPAVRRRLIFGGFFVTLAGAVVASVLLRYVFDPARPLDIRTRIYQTAFELFLEKPLTGHGLFSFGEGFLRKAGELPPQPYTHAHNMLLGVGVELGVIGLAALIVSGIVLARAALKHWSAAAPRDRPALLGGISACVGLGVHHLFDTPAIMPAIALAGIVALSVACAPLQPTLLTARWERQIRSAALTALWTVLVISGLWSSGVYGRYINTLQFALDERDYALGAQRLESVVSADPSLALYAWQQGTLYAWAADQGDAGAAGRGIAAYQQALRHMPHNPVLWVNQAALYWADGQRAQALASMREAVRYASTTWQFQLNLGIYAELSGDATSASTALALAQALSDGVLMPGTINGLLLFEDGARRAALESWVDVYPAESVPGQTIRALLLADQDNVQAAQEALIPVAARAADVVERGWVQMGLYQIALAAGDMSAALQAHAAAREALDIGPNRRDYAHGTDIPYLYFLRFSLVRLFVPQVHYTPYDPVLVRLLMLPATITEPGT